jgi:hypothetical protein
MWTLLYGTALASVSVDQAAAVHLSNQGLQGVVEGLAGVLESGIAVGATSVAFQCDPGDEIPLTLAFDALDLYLVADEVSASVVEGAIVLHLDLGLLVDGPDVQLTGDCLGLLRDVDQTCDLLLGDPEPVDLVVDVRMGLSLGPDGAVDATVEGFSSSLGTLPNPFDDCVLADIFDLLPLLSDPPNDRFFSDLAAQYIDPALEGLGPSLETALEDAFTALPIVLPVELLGSTLTLELAPTAIEVNAGGVLIGLGLTASAPWDEACVPGEADDQGVVGPPPAPPLTGAGWPAMDGTVWGAGGYDAAVLLSKDAVDQLLYEVWQSGLLCVDVASLSPLPIGTSLLGAVYGDGLRALFPTDQPTTLRLAAASPPGASFDEGLVALTLDGLTLELFSELDSREANVARTAMQAEASLDAALVDGTLALSLALDPAGWTFDEVDDHLLPVGYSVSLGAGLPVLLDTFLPADLLPSVVLPALQGIGVGALEVAPSPDGQWHGVFLALDLSSPEPLVIEGCEGGCDEGVDLGASLGCADDSGCGGCGGEEGCDSSCEGGSCTVNSRGAGRVGAVVVVLLTALLRRRRGPSAPRRS